MLNPYFWIGAFLAVAASFGAGYFEGTLKEHKVLIEYQAKVEAAGKAQEEENKAKEEKHKHDTETVKNDYEKRLGDMRKFYSGRVFVDPVHGVVSSTPPVPTTTIRIDEGTADKVPAKPGTTVAQNAPEVIPQPPIASPDVFINQCVETTLQLTKLQDWVKAMQ